MRDQGRIHGPSTDPVEYLRRTISEQGRQIDDLYRRLGEKPPKIGPVTVGPVEVFQFNVDSVLTAATTDDVEIYQSADDYYSSGVSVPSGAYEIAVPSGLWVIGVNMSVGANVANPTSGKVNIQPRPAAITGDWSALASTTVDEVLAAGTSPTLSGSMLCRMTSSTNLGLTYDNDMDEDLYVFGSIWGVQVNAASVTVI